MFEMLVNFINISKMVVHHLAFCPSTSALLLSFFTHKFLTLTFTSHYSLYPSTYPLFPLHSWLAFFSLSLEGGARECSGEATSSEKVFQRDLLNSVNPKHF